LLNSVLVPKDDLVLQIISLHNDFDLSEFAIELHHRHDFLDGIQDVEIDKTRSEPHLLNHSEVLHVLDSTVKDLDRSEACLHVAFLGLISGFRVSKPEHLLDGLERRTEFV